jgi:hypothetical protein
MPAENSTEPAVAEGNGVRWPHIVLIVLVTILLTFGFSYWLLKNYLFLREFEPVSLNVSEQQVLERKLRAIGIDVSGTEPRAVEPIPADEIDERGFLKPERYSEVGATREVSFSERELNGMLANNTDLARKLAIDLSDDLVSAKLLVPLEPDFPVMGGKTLRVTAGVEMAYQGSKPIVILKGVSVMGVPVPNAWLGNLKNVDLVNEFGADQGFWKAFADGVDNIRVEDGEMLIQLKE